MTNYTIRKINAPVSRLITFGGASSHSSIRSGADLNRAALRSTHSLKATAPLTVSEYLTNCLPRWKERLAKDYIQSKLASSITISDIAAACSLSRSHFSRAFKKSTGLSPQQWVINMRIEKAQTLLRTSSLSLTEIGLECGFSDQSHFSKTFAKSLGMPPKNWRRAFSQEPTGKLESGYSRNVTVH